MTVSPKTQLVRALSWVVISLVFLEFGRSHVENLKAAGRYVGPWRYGIEVFWVLILIFWLWNAWKSWKQLKTSEG